MKRLSISLCVLAWFLSGCNEQLLPPRGVAKADLAVDQCVRNELFKACVASPPLHSAGTGSYESSRIHACSDTAINNAVRYTNTITPACVMPLPNGFYLR